MDSSPDLESANRPDNSSLPSSPELGASRNRDDLGASDDDFALNDGKNLDDGEVANEFEDELDDGEDLFGDDLAE